MLPRKVKVYVLLGFLILCSSARFADAEEARSSAWQEGPLNCYVCDSAAECAASKGTLRKCENNDAQTCVVVFDATGAVSQRGCSDSVAAEFADYCAVSADHCPNCASSGCNVAASLDQFIECIACDSEFDTNCALNPASITTRTMCLGECMTALHADAANADQTHVVRSCLSDRDLDDRARCLDGSDSQCIGCLEAGCNVHIVSERRRSCYHCNSDGEDDCAEPLRQECASQADDVRCFMRFDADNDIVGMGCVSDFESEVAVEALVKQKLLYVCVGDDCNDPAHIPMPQTCIKCNSLTDEKCATQPLAVRSQDNCRSIPYTDCYQRTVDGTTERGCLSELSADEFYECLSDTSKLCKTCYGESCNTQFIPEDRPQCQRCNSELDSSCHDSPASQSACPVYSENDSCVAVYEKRVTKRGCLSEFNCDATASSCEICRGSGCNTANVKKRAEEVYGAFQTLPLNCNTCSGAECLSGVRNARKCEGDIYQDCVTVFDESGAVVRRGCEVLVLAEYQTHCAQYPELCFNCKSNGCNTVSEPSAYQECLYCDAAVDANCLFNPTAVTVRRKCVEGCLSALYPRRTNAKVQDFVRSCLEDIEPDDRDNCTAENNCVRCTDANACNVDILPADGRLSCQFCEGADCNVPTVRQCAGYTASDQCYIYFNNVTHDAIRMGCKSDITPGTLRDEIKNYFLCDGDNCNDYTNLPEAIMCYVCDSSTDANCAINPMEIRTQSRCQFNPTTDCYTRITSGGHTIRGCTYDLSTDDFISCHDGGPESICRICTASNCNRNVYPSSRQRCHRCNSADDPDCGAAPDHSQVCPLYQADDVCVSKLIAGVIHRDCGSALSCADASAANCRTCNENNCNTDDFKSESIGDPGMFQELPLNCYHCEGSAACATVGNVNKCEGNNLQTCTTVFDSAGQVTGRGCSDLMTATCSADDASCYDCKSNGCNSATSESDYVSCVFCDAQQGDACVFDVASVTGTRQCHKSCLTALYPRTKDTSAALELVRTCLDDMDLDDRERCAASSQADCQVCSTDNCNTADLGQRKSCYHCAGNDCQSPEQQTCRAVTEQEQCSVEFDETGTIVAMGCKSNYDPPALKVLVTAKRLWLCDDDNCNTFDNLPTAQDCVLCNSRTDEECAVAPGDIYSYTSCAQVPVTQCYTRLLNSGHTERGCLSSIEGEEYYNCLYGTNTTECLQCTGRKCNAEIFPENRRSCHICNSNTSAGCESSPQSAEICLKYSSGEKCVSAVTTEGVTVRGCSSQVTCDSKDTEICQICGDNDCNSENLKRKTDGKPGIWQQLPLTCHQCNSNAECANAASEVVCSGNEYCMTVFDVNGAVTKRGCSDAVESEFGNYCDTNSPNCHNCNSNKCNNANSLSDYIDCVYCDSSINADCALNAAAVKGRRSCNGACMTALYPQAINSDVFALTRTCLDDKDAADQQACASGDDHCTTCNSPICNVDALPANRLSCYQCQGEDCEDPSATQCANYKENDQCFMLFNDASNLVRMGCASELTATFITANFHLLYTCDAGDNCNGFENIPKPQVCATCNSVNDPRCATDPGDTPAVDQCNKLPHTGCYTQINYDGATSRGCVSNLARPVLSPCLNGTMADCTACQGDRCNIEIFPSDRRRCQRCNTKEDPTCESDPQAGAVCPNYNPSEFCATKLVNGHTYRDCSSEFQCDDADKQYCRMCHSGDNCNVVDLANNVVGLPGLWQGLPINCYTCLGVECQGVSLGAVRKCENNNLQTCVTVFAENGTVAQRGCSDAVYASDDGFYCDLYPASCKVCKSNGCNTATKLDDYVDCVFCNGVDDTACVNDVESIKRTRSCHQKCFTGLYPRTQEPNPAYELTRGCLDDLDLDDREACESGDLANCKACATDACNKDTIPATRRSCYVCEGEDCEDPVSQFCAAYRENDQCFTLFDPSTNSAERMGCASDLDTADIEENRRQLLLCDDDNCNDFANLPTGTGCRVCNSLTEPDCASSPSEVGVAAACNNLPYTQCYMHVDAAGVTHRGCVSDVDDDLFDDCFSGNSSTCAVCSVNNCNTEVYPSGRRSCNRCNTQEDSECADSGAQFASICPVYDAADVCVTKVDGEHLWRGCSSDFTCDPADRATCRLCNSDNCNTIDLLAADIGEPGKWQGLPLNCYVCEGTACAGSGGTIRKCEGNNLQTCVTVFGTDGAVEKRGCSDAVLATHADYCDEHYERCVGCKSSGCNDANSLDDFVDCYFCDSVQSNSCSVDFDTTTSRTRKCQQSCMVALYPRSSVANPAYELSRSCLDDMDLDEREQCAAGDLAYCVACVGSRCNAMSVPAERHECYRCVGDDCEDVAVRGCNAHQENDQCYILFDSENSVIAMGCRSEFELNVVDELVKQKKILLCDGKNCNGPETIPQPSVCAACNSELDPRCATNPNLIETTAKCTLLPYVDCYARIDSDGRTARGCVSSLDSDDFYGCVNGEDDLCETCSGDKCNALTVFPTDRWTCHQCNSATDPLCSSAPNSNKVCPVYSENDACVTNLHNGVTTRGCASSLKCSNDDDKRTCRVCNTPGCNTVDLEKVGADGQPGLWQDVPITCYTCAGAEACESGGEALECEENPFQNCMTVFDGNGRVIQRGCSDAVEAANGPLCNTTPQQCPRCNSNRCNVATNLDAYVECLACDTDSSGACVHNVGGISTTRLCYKHCMTALYAKYAEENPAYGLARSCYDDMEAADRDECEAGTKTHCEVCSTAKCNAVAMPAERLSCNVCAGDDCQDPQPTTCPTYRTDDQCYIRFDEQRSIEAMGCRSEFSNADADYLLQQKRLFLCAEDDCNTFAALPTAKTCKLCSSRTDVNCASEPSSVSSSTTCSALPFTDCYERVLPNGSTERGCLSSLYDDEFLGCMNGTSSTCRSCRDHNCNDQVFPDDRLACHICDSAQDPLCEANPNSVAVCPLYDAEDTCVTAYLGDVTYRGCSSSISCAADPMRCVKCGQNGCNTVNLARKQDDNFGKWQNLPLRCYICSGVQECSTLQPAQISTCADNNLQDCVTVFDNTGNVISRGCSDAINEEHGDYCDQTSSCYNCKSNECNTPTSEVDMIKCVYCDSHRNVSCVLDPENPSQRVRLCDGACMTALYPSDSSSDPAYDLIRTCLNDKETSDQTKCSRGSDGNCVACTDSYCNAIDFPADRRTCYTCDGEDCEDPQPQACALYKKDDKCYTWFDSTNSVSQMGCLSSFRSQDLETIIGTKRVYVCDGDNCNSLEEVPGARQCVVCDSNEDYSCATNAYEIGAIATCSELPYTNCYTRLGSDGSTARGCLASLPVNTYTACVLGSDENCSICGEDGCNREIFPVDRQQCYTCSSEDDAICESFPTRSRPCPYVSDTESCRTALSGNVTIRGCRSEVFCDASDKSTCRECFGTGCNAIDLRNKKDDGYHGVWQDLPLQCHTCVGDHCLNSLGPAITCTTNLEQDCMTVFNATGDVLRRGCSDDVEDYLDLYCRQNPQLCFTCKSNDCNSAWNMADYVECAFCDSATDALCVVNPENAGFATRSCNKECMVAFKGADVIRSCLDDKEIFLQHVCRANDDTNECAACEGDLCNTFVYPPDRLKCHICTGFACTSSVAEYCRSYDKNDFCFAKYESGKVDLMGCASSQNSSDLEEWTEQKKLYRCEGNECNALSKLPSTGVCLSCHSSLTPNCAQNPLRVASTILCNAPNGQCVTTVNAAGYTLRGCLLDLDTNAQNTCEAAGTCAVCLGERCNNQIFPTNRRKCHICSGADCEKVPNGNPSVCPIYVANDRCVSKLEDQLTSRGCESNLTCDVNDQARCEICDSDGCNTAELSGAPALAAVSLLLTIVVAFVATVGL